MLKITLVDALGYLADRVDLPEDLAGDVDALKATIRDREEPGRFEKMRTEWRITQLLTLVFGKQKAMVEAAVQERTGRKAITDIDDWFDYSWEDADRAELVKIIQEAAVNGVNLLAGQTGISFDPTLINARAARWAQRFAGQLIKGVNDTTRQAVREAVRQFVETPGFTIGDLIRQLPFTGFRAEMIAVTETTRSYAEGNLEAAAALRKEFPDVKIVKQWFTNNDDRVCPICGPLDGRSVLIEQDFNSIAGQLNAPPAHPNCRCWISTRTVING